MDYLGICLLSAAIIVLGIFMVRKPDWCWKLKHALDTEGGEPSKYYLATVKVLGTAMIHSRPGLGGLVHRGAVRLLSRLRVQAAGGHPRPGGGGAL